jgi:hypothetical protein
VIAVLAPIATLVVGLVAGFIAWQQWRLARQKLRLDLFDWRFKVFEATRRFLSQILKHAQFSDSELFEFFAGTSDAEFLFGKDVVSYLTELRTRSLEMRKHRILFDPLPVGDERSKHVQGHHDQLLWLGEQAGNVQKPFLPYLGFSHVK